MQSELSLFISIGGGALVVILAVFFGLKQKRSETKQRGTKTSESLFMPQKGFASSLKKLFSSSGKNFEQIIPELEEILLSADVGVVATQDLIEKVVAHKNNKSLQDCFEFLKAELKDLLTPTEGFVPKTEKPPYVIYLVGVNGVGKTTTIGKLAHQFKEQGLSVMLIAADTFRAAAVEQLKIWSERNQVHFMSGAANADPSSVIIDGLRSAKAKQADVVLVDTAGRLQTKKNLMDELSKMTRMCEKELLKKPDEIFLVVDAITGQNGFSQAKIFLEAVALSGVVLTKYDATSKGGIIISIVKETGLPVRFVGLGEGINDLKPFHPDDFVEKLFDVA
ncbi:MAG: signal recognition particle-docking protein FtsY [Deltaproteobacteria bacterium]|nr:signal recognition particle-docking protein FtsY [Deltaproteobacteria bacterium]